MHTTSEFARSQAHTAKITILEPLKKKRDACVKKKPLEMVIFTRNDVLQRRGKKTVRYIVEQERKDIQVYRLPGQIYTTINTLYTDALFRLYSGSIKALLKLYYLRNCGERDGSRLLVLD